MGIKPRRLDPDTIYNFLGRRRVKSEDCELIDRGNIVEIISSQPLGKPTVRNATPESTGRLLVAHITILPGKEGEAVEWSQTEQDTGDAPIGAHVYLEDSGKFTMSPRGRAVGQVLRKDYILLDPNANYLTAEEGVPGLAEDWKLSNSTTLSLSELNEGPVLVVPAEPGVIIVESVELRTSVETPFEAAQNALFVLRYEGGRREASGSLRAAGLVSESAVGVIRAESVVAPENTGVCISLKGGKLKGDGVGTLSVVVFYSLY